MAISSRVSLYDGTTTVLIDGRATLRVRLGQRSAGGSTNLRMANGSITRQVAWERDTVTLSCSGWTPPGLDSIDWSKRLTLAVPAPGGTRQFVGYADRPQETDTAAESIDCEWVLTLEAG